MMNRGVFFPRRGPYHLLRLPNNVWIESSKSSPTLEMLKPYVAEAAPHLLAGGDVIDEVHLDGRYKEVAYQSD
jgi:hypothetical protein